MFCWVGKHIWMSQPFLLRRGLFIDPSVLVSSIVADFSKKAKLEDSAFHVLVA